jgi:MinD-like ATPase involved in chromosome partitioning or flagellar assembly
MAEREFDQAAGLRRMFWTTRAHIVAVVGGSPGAGATTCAVNLAAALRRQGRRVLLIDSTGAPNVDTTADIVLVDAKADAQGGLACTQGAHDVIVVVSPGACSITGGYAAIKRMNQTHGRRRFQLLVNRANDDFTARRVQMNMARVARQHLDVSVEYMGAIPRDSALTASARRSLSVVDAAPTAAASRAFCERSAAMLGWAVSQIDSNRLDNFMQRAIYGSRVAAVGAGV